MRAASRTEKRAALFVCLTLVSLAASSFSNGADAAKELAKIPVMGDTAKDFELGSLSGSKVSLHGLTKKGPVVLVVLRGFPGYQCPLCTLQVAGLRQKAKDFAEAGAQVILVYPGANEKLAERAREFLRGQELPEPIQLLVDPDYTFTNAYGLRWNAPKETAFPSTFVIGTDNKIVYAKISKKHGGRSDLKEILAALPKLK